MPNRLADVERRWRELEPAIRDGAAGSAELVPWANIMCDLARIVLDHMPVPVPCAACDGRGVVISEDDPPATVRTCRQCGGSGRMASYLPGPELTGRQIACPDCGGRPSARRCPTCRGLRQVVVLDRSPDVPDGQDKGG